LRKIYANSMRVSLEDSGLIIEKLRAN